MMNDDNKEFTKQVKKDLLNIVSKINKQLNETDSVIFDTDCDTLREIRREVICSIDCISHLEYKELI